MRPLSASNLRADRGGEGEWGLAGHAFTAREDAECACGDIRDTGARRSRAKISFRTWWKSRDRRWMRSSEYLDRSLNSLLSADDTTPERTYYHDDLLLKRRHRRQGESDSTPPQAA